MIVKCPNCDSKYKLDPAKFTSPEPKIRCKKCNNVFKAVEEPAAPAPAAAAAPPPPAPKAAPAPAPAAAKPAPAAPKAAPAAAPAAAGGQLVLVGHESPEVTGLAEELLKEAGYQTIIVHDGIQALMEIESRRPAVAVLDVALPKMFGFEIVEVARRDPALAGVKLILIAAIYDKTRYKRNPQSLYGADDYIEKHLIPDTIVEKVAALASGAPAAAPAAAPAPKAAPAAAAPKAAPAPAAPAKPAAPKPAAAAAPAPAAFDESSLTPEEREDHEKAKRLARIIVSDIALYNAEALTESVKGGNPMQALAGDIEEGRKLFVERVPANMRGRFDYLGVALEDLFAKKRKELGLAV